MFDTDRLKESHIHNNEWIKRLRRSSDLEDIGKAIRDRIEFSAATGPYIFADKGEDSIDIISALIEVEPDLRDKIEKTVGLLLYKMKHGEIGPSQKIYQGIFSMIRVNKFVECRTLLHNWIKDNVGILVRNDKSLPFYEQSQLDGERGSYKEALFALAYIQGKDSFLQDWWLNLWRECYKYWQFYAFVGLRRQNPGVACGEIPLLLDRKLTGTAMLLSNFWRDEFSRGEFVRAIRNGLRANEKWSGLAMNTALEKMFPLEKDEFFAALKGNSLRIIGNTTQKVLITDI